MADIMISYARSDRMAVLRLSALLSANGYSTWWDAELRAGDQFRDEISNEIRNARAVIVIWSSSSVLSNWVRAEANLGQSLGTLVSVKYSDVKYADIPLPFGELNTPDLDDEPAILDALRAVITRPHRHLPVHQWLAAKLRHEALTWLGIIGGALTLAASVTGLLKMSEVFRVLMDNWTGALRLLWRTVFLNTLHVGPYDAVFLTILSLVGVNLAVALLKPRKTQETGLKRGMQATSVGIAFLVLTIVGVLGAMQAEERNNRLAEKEFEIAIVNTFSGDAECAATVRQVNSLGREFFAPFANMFPEDDPEVLDAIRRGEDCFKKHGISAADFSAQRTRVNLEFDERGRDYVGRFGAAFAFFGHVLAPVLIYLCLRLFTRVKVDIGLFAKRLWLVIFGAALLATANSLFVALEAVDWRGILERA